MQNQVSGKITLLIGLKFLCCMGMYSLVLCCSQMRVIDYSVQCIDVSFESNTLTCRQITGKVYISATPLLLMFSTRR